MVPRSARKCRYSECICDDDELWPDPDYAIGQRWSFYGGMDSYIYTVVMVTDTQLLLSYPSPYDGEPQLMLAKCYKGHYANIGTPELRIKVA